MSQTARFDAYGKAPPPPAAAASRHAALRERLDCRFPAIDDVFDDCIDEALRTLTPAGMAAYLDQARWFGKLGRGAQPVLQFLATWPAVAHCCGESSLAPLCAAAAAFQKSPNGPAIVTLLHSLPAVARQLPAPHLLAQYLALTVELMQRTSLSIHGRHATEPSPGLPAFLQQAGVLVALVPMEGLRRWVQEGIRLHGAHPQRQIDYFSLTSADARALLQRERRGTLLIDVERRLALGLRGLWDVALPLVPYPVHVDPPTGQPLLSHLQDDGLRLPEVLDDRAGVSALQRYRAMLAHLAGHLRWSTPQLADNLSPLQRLALECFEDARVDHLVLRRYPGLRPALLALHPMPAEDACDAARVSCLRHRLVCLSRALLDPAHPYRDATLLAFAGRFRAALRDGVSSTREMAVLALDWSAATRRASDQRARVQFEDTLVDWRDDNRHLWTFIEPGDEEDTGAEPRRRAPVADEGGLPPRLYPEWDHLTRGHRPDWVSVYDILQPPGQAGDVDALLAQYAPVARHLKRRIDLLKPQDRTRLRHQEEGTELDLDLALRAIADWRAGAQPDPRIHTSTRTDGRDISVLLLMDLSQSVNQTVGQPHTGAPAGGAPTVLSLSRAAAALLGWAIAALGDELAIAGFQSNTRQEVRYLHLKGFTEAWGDAPKARLAAAQGAWSTRMGAALRHAGHLLSGRRADKRLLLVLTDGEPADIDVDDPQYLIADAAQAVRELDRQGLYTHCISLDARADAYVSRIFGQRWTVIDRVEQLPRRLPELFLALTR